MQILKKLFKGRSQGKDFTKNWDLNEKDQHTLKRTGALGASGAGTGAVIGLAAGGIKAYSQIQKVPMNSVTVDHYEQMSQRDLLGHIPPDDYEHGSWRPSDDGVPTEPVYRNNPVYSGDGTPRVDATSTTFRGRGEAQPVTWRTENIVDRRMNESYPYDYSTRENNERYVSHYETVHKSRQVSDGQESYTETVSDTDCSTSYNSDGSTSQDCDTTYRDVTRYRTKYRTEHYTEEEPQYAWRTLGHWQTYTENIESRVVGTVEKPNVEFDHGVDVGNYLLKGLLWGAAIGAVAGGVAAAMEEKYFPNILPGYTPKPGSEPVNPEPTPPIGGDPVEPAPPKPTPPVGGDPVKPAPPKPTPPIGGDPVKPAPPDEPHTCDGRMRHTHDELDFRHTHGGADRWHYHGCPDTGVANEDIICFKPTQVPDCYEDDKPISNCDANGSVCFTNHG